MNSTRTVRCNQISTSGAVPHVCLGQHVARAKICAGITILIKRLPGLRLDPAVEAPRIIGMYDRGPRRAGALGPLMDTTTTPMVGFGSVLYGSTKGAINQMTNGLAIECAPYNIRVNAICPAGMPLTNFSAADNRKFAPPDQGIVDYLASVHPLGRVITAEDCAEAAVFLCSGEAINITGVLLPIDGGYVAQELDAVFGCRRPAPNNILYKLLRGLPERCQGSRLLSRRCASPNQRRWGKWQSGAAIGRSG